MTIRSSQPSRYGGALVKARLLVSSNGLRLARALGRLITANRPPIGWALALLFLFKGMVCIATVAFPISPSEPKSLIAVAGVVAIVSSFLVWLFSLRISVFGFELLASVGSLVASALIARAVSHGGMMLAAFEYPWIVIYAAHFFPRRGVIVQGVLISIGFAVGLALDGLSQAGIYWVIVTVTIWSICLVLGHLSESLRRLAVTDPLTGLLNRSGFLAAAMREQAMAARTGSPLTLVVLDLDDFKQINDQLGHLVGDKLLADLGRAWRQRLRTGDILARHGGDEFMLLLPATSLAVAESVVERLAVQDIPIRWSVGMGQWLPGESLDECIARADASLYGAKDAMRVGRVPRPLVAST